MFKGSKTGSYLSIEPHKGLKIPVGVWEVSESDELQLDIYEGCPSFYYKQELELDVKGIRTGKIRHRNAFMYIMHEDRPYGLPSRYYVRTCIEGYFDFKFDSELLKKAINDTKECLENEK